MVGSLPPKMVFPVKILQYGFTGLAANPGRRDSKMSKSFVLWALLAGLDRAG